MAGQSDSCIESATRADGFDFGSFLLFVSLPLIALILSLWHGGVVAKWQSMRSTLSEAAIIETGKFPADYSGAALVSGRLWAQRPAKEPLTQASPRIDVIGIRVYLEQLKHFQHRRMPDTYRWKKVEVSETFSTPLFLGKLSVAEENIRWLTPDMWVPAHPVELLNASHASGFKLIGHYIYRDTPNLIAKTGDYRYRYEKLSTQGEVTILANYIAAGKKDLTPLHLAYNGYAIFIWQGIHSKEMLKVALDKEMLFKSLFFCAGLFLCGLAGIAAKGWKNVSRKNPDMPFKCFVAFLGAATISVVMFITYFSIIMAALYPLVIAKIRIKAV